MKTVTVKDSTAKPEHRWTVRLIEKGDYFGTSGTIRNDREPLVEFYSLRYADEMQAEPDGIGSFVDRYDLETLTTGWEADSPGPVLTGRGLVLDLSAPDLCIGGEALREAIAALTGKTSAMW